MPPPSEPSPAEEPVEQADRGAPRERAGAPDPSGQVTRLLRRWSAGEEEAFERLLPLVYGDLRAIAHRRLEGERSGHTLQTTALVHEAYLRLVDVEEVDWSDRAHFFAIASKIVRRVLVEYARRRNADKRGGTRTRVQLTPAAAEDDPRDQTLEVLALDRALTELARRDPRLEQVVEHRFFGGLSVEETAEVLDVSGRTVERDWRRARTYLYRALGEGEALDGEGEG